MSLTISYAQQNFDDDAHNIDLFASMLVPTSYTLFEINANTITSCPTGTSSQGFLEKHS
jgi:hypothetical protein